MTGVVMVIVLLAGSAAVARCRRRRRSGDARHLLPVGYRLFEDEWWESERRRHQIDPDHTVRVLPGGNTHG